jgi:hypothetical protein
MAAKRLSPGQKLLVTFILTIFAPGLLLALFGARALWQERQLADQQLRDRLDRDADVAMRSLADDFAQRQSTVDGDLPPDKAFRDLPEDGSWVI